MWAVDGYDLAEHLDLGVGVGKQVLIPAGVLGRAALGGDDHPALAVGAVDQRRGALLTGAAPGGGEQQDGGAPPVIPALTAAVAVDADVLCAEEVVV